MSNGLYGPVLWSAPQGQSESALTTILYVAQYTEGKHRERKRGRGGEGGREGEKERNEGRKGGRKRERGGGLKYLYEHWLTDSEISNNIAH